MMALKTALNGPKNLKECRAELQMFAWMTALKLTTHYWETTTAQKIPCAVL
jgi:hypothetical protein